MKEIPVYSLAGRVVDWIEEALVESLRGVEIVRNRRGHVKRVNLTTFHVGRLRPKHLGRAFEQELTCGHVWALGGVRGSER